MTDLEIEIAQDGPDTYLLRLRSRPGHRTPEVVRLRALLKAAGRRFGFRCLEVRGEATGLPLREEKA